MAASQFSTKVDLTITLPFDRNSIQYSPPPAATFPYEPVNEQVGVFPAPDVVPMSHVTLSYKEIGVPLVEWIAFGMFVLLACVFTHSTGMIIHPQYPRTNLTSFTGAIPSSSSLLRHHHLTWPNLSVPSCCLPCSSHLLFFWASDTSYLPVSFGRITHRPDAVKEVRIRLELFGLSEW